MKIPSYVTVIELKSGRRYEVRLEATFADGKRHQPTRRFRTLKEVIDAHAKVTLSWVPPQQVSGRSTPDPTAFDPPATRTSSAGGTATAAVAGAGTSPTTAPGHGAPMIPRMGGVGTGGGGGMSPRSDRDAPRVYSPEAQPGEPDEPDIVKGGTIAQNRPENAA